ncbi:MAG: transporter, partial [Cellvibrionaceae bacterium]|nr:transporter [Cellvibrionaceae bacterium]
MLQKLNTSMHKKIAVILLTAVASQACADEGHSPSGAQSHAPIGVMGDHIHKKGEFMFSYRFMQMGMEANRNRGDDLRPEEVIRFENTFAGRPMQPPLLRVVPLEMTMDMHMFGAMYAPSDKLTLMLMTNYLEKTMDHVTFNGNGEPLGFFTTETDGIGDTSLSALINWADNVHATVGVSLPTGSIEETGEILTPMGQTPTVRLPYPMQLGSGTYDVIIGLT